MWRNNNRIAGSLLGALLTLAPFSKLAHAQTENLKPSDTTSASESAVSPSENKAKASLFYFLVMSGKTQDQFQPLTQSQRTEAYLKGLFSPFLFVNAGFSAGITQWQDVPHSWGQGAEGYVDYPALEAAVTYLACHARRAHPERDRRTGHSQLGLEPLFGSDDVIEFAEAA